MMEASKEGAMLERELDEWVYFLLEWKIHAYAHRFGFTGEIDAFVGSLHQSGPPPVMMSQPISANACEARFVSS